MSSSGENYTLYTYFRSSCSARLRIALHLKSIPFDPIPINLLKNEQGSETHRRLNPSGAVPVFIPPHPHRSDAATSHLSAISQSVAALEYLEEAHPDRRSLMPPASDIIARATVRVLVNIMACDVQPVTNLRILKRVDELNGDRAQWANELMGAGFAAYEEVVAKTAGRYSVGDEITLADVCLVPAVWGSVRYGVDLENYPVVKRIYEELSKEDAVIKAHWKNQADTPEDLRK